MEQMLLFVPREDILCWLLCSLVCIPYGLISLQPPENHIDVFCTAPCSLPLNNNKLCMLMGAGTGTPGTSCVPAWRWPRQHGTQQWEEMAVAGDDIGGAPHTTCPVGDSLSGDACVSGIIYIWLKAKITVGKKLTAQGWLALGVKGGSTDATAGISLSVGTSLLVLQMCPHSSCYYSSFCYFCFPSKSQLRASR